MTTMSRTVVESLERCAIIIKIRKVLKLTFRELSHPIYFAIRRIVQATHHDARMLAREFARGLSYVKRDICCPLPEAEHWLDAVRWCTKNDPPKKLGSEPIRDTQIVEGLWFALCQPLE
jgi:hypothetical protein